MSLSSYPHFTGDPYEKSFEFIDTVLLAAPEQNSFRWEDLIKESDLPQIEKDIAQYISSHFRNLIINDLKYIETLPNDIWKVRLTKLGLQVKKAGGHAVYLKKLEDRAVAETKRQMLNDEKLKYDVKNSKRIFKTYWWTFWFSVISVLYVLVQIVLKIIQATKPHIDN